MGAHMAGPYGHATVGSFYDYNRPEHKQVTGIDLVTVFSGDGRLVGRFNRDELEVFARGAGLRSRMRTDSNPGQELSFTLPADVVAAMKHKDLLDSPSRAYPLLVDPARSAMAKLNEEAFGRTTNGKLVKVNLYYAFMYGYTNRAGEAAPQVNVWVFGYGQAANGKHFAVDTRRLYYAQKTAQAAWHMEVSRKLLEDSITCVPVAHSIKALGIKAETKRALQVKAQLLAVPFDGPAARALVVVKSRAPKPDVTWAEAVRNLGSKVVGRMERGLHALSGRREERLAERCIKAAFRYHNQSGAARYSRRDAYATGAHLALPQVSLETYNRVFERLTKEPERLKVMIWRVYPDGNVLYAPKAQVSLEQEAARVLGLAQGVGKGGLSRSQVGRALAGQGLDLYGYSSVQAIADKRRVVLERDATKDPVILQKTAAAYSYHGRKVFAVGKEAGKALGLPAYTAHGFAEKLDRTPHLQALWQGLRTKGTLNQRLDAATRIRRRKPPVALGKNSLIVASVDLEDTRALLRILSAARKTNSKVVVTGPAAGYFADLVEHQRVFQRQKGARM